jgi:hypothetical protein
MAALLNVSIPFKRHASGCNVFYHFGSKEAILLWFATDRLQSEKIAREKYAPFNRIADTQEPWFDGERVHLPASTHAAASRKRFSPTPCPTSRHSGMSGRSLLLPLRASEDRRVAYRRRVARGDLPRDGRSVF